MRKLQVARLDRIAVCDGGKALVLENIGDERFPSLRVRDSQINILPRTSAMGRERPGRVHQSANPARSSVEGTNLHERGEEVFLHSLVDQLNQAAEAGEFEHVVIVAPPHALGLMRPRYSGTLRKRIRTEVAEDLVHCSVSEIELHLFG